MWLFVSCRDSKCLQEKKWNFQLWLLLCSRLRNDSCRAGSTSCFKAHVVILHWLYFKSVSCDYKTVRSLFYDDSSACSAFVCLGHWLRPGLNSCYKLLLVTGMCLHPGLNACSRQWYVLRCTACKFLLHYSLFTANTDSSLAQRRPLRTKRPDVSDPPSGRRFIFKYHKLDDMEQRGAWHIALS